MKMSAGIGGMATSAQVCGPATVAVFYKWDNANGLPCHVGLYEEGGEGCVGCPLGALFLFVVIFIFWSFLETLLFIVICIVV